MKIDRSAAIELANTSLELWYSVRKAEDDAEIGQNTDSSQNITALPEVPAQDAPTSNRKATDALSQATQLLNGVLQDPNLAMELAPDDIQHLRLVAQFLNQGPRTPMHLMKMGDVRLSVKAIIKGRKGSLYLKDAYSDFWDLPGGHVQDGERLDKALQREVYEETGQMLIGAQEKFVKVLKLGNEVKPVVFYDAIAGQGPILLSEEHTGYMWADDRTGMSLNLGVFKEILYPGPQTAHEPMGQSPTNKPAAGGMGGNAAFHASVDKGMFGDPESAIVAIEQEHGSRLQRSPKMDGDVLLTCPADGEMWYVTADGMAFEYWHPEEGKTNKIGPMAAFVGGTMVSDSLDDELDKGMGEEDDLTNSHFEAAQPLYPPAALVTPEDSYPGNHDSREDSFLDQPTATVSSMVKDVEGMDAEVIERTEGRGVQDYDAGNEGKAVEISAGGQLRYVEQLKEIMDQSPLEKEGGDGGGADAGLGISGPGDSLTSESAHTEVGGSSRRYEKAGTAPPKPAGGDSRAGTSAGSGGDDQPKKPPREGLVPQSGDWVHPGHWIDPDKEGGPGSRKGSDDKVDTPTPEDKPKGAPGGGTDATCEGAITSTQDKGFPPPWNDENDNEKGYFGQEFGGQQETVAHPQGEDITKYTDMLTDKDPARKINFQDTTRGVQMKVIKRRNTLPLIYRSKVKFMKAVKDDPKRYDLKVLNKGMTPQMPMGTMGHRYIVAGYASPVMVDLEGHKITHQALAQDLPRFMAEDGQYANLNVLHSNVTVGKILPEFSDGIRVWKTQVDKIGLYVVAEIRTDPAAPEICRQVIDDIEAGRLRSFSISGNAENPTFQCDAERCFYAINDLQLYEITLCEEGVNPEAKFDVVSKMLAKANINLITESDVLTYFHTFKNMWSMTNRTGGYEVVLYDAKKGEVVLPEEGEGNFPYHMETPDSFEAEKGQVAIEEKAEEPDPAVYAGTRGGFKPNTK